MLTQRSSAPPKNIVEMSQVTAGHTSHIRELIDSHEPEIDYKISATTCSTSKSEPIPRTMFAEPAA